ncbi:hypothetical protein NLU13_5165 [Sarocladium strictum]|uniref:Uncharacterized protein n=1 Tax=Sarocladium strictum TaxID=5046 RepID=A0AA39L7D7_SARSR|nr:hypothetical protein NLU13_5165 [Sarocladium strictum]
MCVRNVIEYKCKHQIPRGGYTRCFREQCPGRRDEMSFDADNCPNCEAKKRIRSSRWCPVGCNCTVM